MEQYSSLSTAPALLSFSLAVGVSPANCIQGRSPAPCGLHALSLRATGIHPAFSSSAPLPALPLSHLLSVTWDHPRTPWGTMLRVPELPSQPGYLHTLTRRGGIQIGHRPGSNPTTSNESNRSGDNSGTTRYKR